MNTPHTHCIVLTHCVTTHSLIHSLHYHLTESNILPHIWIYWRSQKNVDYANKSSKFEPSRLVGGLTEQLEGRIYMRQVIYAISPNDQSELCYMTRLDPQLDSFSRSSDSLAA